jgi:hypothetical protein
MRWFILIVLLLNSCKTIQKPQPDDTRIKRTDEYQQEIDTLLATDAENKRWARIYLSEIDTAMANDDMHAYVFFVGEFEKIPLELVPHHLRNEPNYAGELSALELHFRLRWFEQAVLLYKQQSEENK